MFDSEYCAKYTCSVFKIKVNHLLRSSALLEEFQVPSYVSTVRGNGLSGKTQRRRLKAEKNSISRNLVK